MKLRDKIFGGVVIFLCAGLVSCQKELHWEEVEEPGAFYDVSFVFEHTVSDSRLELNTMDYINGFGEGYTITAFKYYISNIELRNTVTGRVTGSGGENDYFLIDASDESSLSFAASFEEGEYDQIKFLIGVDSTRNVSGAQTGALDPTNGMFWTWNTGYVMAKLEGTSDVATTPDRAFTWHIGGFRTGESVLKTVIFDLPGTERLIVDSTASGRIELAADMNAWFRNVHDMPIAENSFVHSPGETALRFADNYADMFSLLFAGNP